MAALLFDSSLHKWSLSSISIVMVFPSQPCSHLPASSMQQVSDLSESELSDIASLKIVPGSMKLRVCTDLADKCRELLISVEFLFRKRHSPGSSFVHVWGGLRSKSTADVTGSWHRLSW